MQEQIIEQTIVINYANQLVDAGPPASVDSVLPAPIDTALSALADTGLSTLAFIAAGAAMIVVAFLIYYFAIRGRGKFEVRTASRWGGLGAFIVAFSLAALAITMPVAQAAPTLTLSTGDKLTVAIPEGGGSALAETIISTTTANATGYTLQAELGEEEPGIGISLMGGNLTESTLLSPGVIHPLAVTEAANATDEVDTTTVTLNFDIDGTVTPGTKTLKLIYTALDNEPEDEPVAPPVPLTMQSLTQDYCTNSMTVYDGTNPSAILALVDTRADQQTYEVAKLADDKCWMLNNLKLGSTSGAVELTPTDSNIASNFTLPQLITSGAADYDNPQAIGPVPGDTGSGATNYGYLYNWSAATAGESRTSHDETAGDAPYSICPAGWRLPSRGTGAESWDVSDPTNEFSVLSARMAGFTDNQDTTYVDNYWNYAQGWQYDGPFKGALAGYWWDGFNGQGSWGLLWSSSANPGWADLAPLAYFDASEVSPSDSDARSFGFGVRCLLN